MFSPVKSLFISSGFVAASLGGAWASDASDVARTTKLPASVVDNVLSNVDDYFASADAPANHMVSGIVKELVLKAVKNRMSNLEDAAPGKSSDQAFEDKYATYRASVRTTSHNTSETRDCVDNKISLTNSEGVPVVKDGQFAFDLVHPRVTNWSWMMTFCRAATSNGEFGEWQMAADGR